VLEKDFFVNRKFAKLIMRLSAASAAAVFAAACSTTPKLIPANGAGPATPTSPVYLLSDISGASPQSIDTLLGPPNLSRREGTGEYRRYDLSTCALIIILYPDEAGAVRAANIDTAALTVGDDKPDLNTCLAAG